jgi:hypothetical protein
VYGRHGSERRRQASEPRDENVLTARVRLAQGNDRETDALLHGIRGQLVVIDETLERLGASLRRKR